MAPDLFQNVKEKFTELIDRLGFDRVLFVLLGLATFGLLMLGMGGSNSGWVDNRSKVTFFQIGTGSTGGTYFPMGEALAAVISHPPGSESCAPGHPCGVPGLVAIAKGSAGSVANVRAVSTGRFDSALVQANVLAAAYNGTGEFEGEPPRANLRVIANLYPESVHLIAARGLFIGDVTDLVGKRVSIGPEGSGTRADALTVLEAYGVGLDQIDVVEADASRSAEMILAGTLDAYFLVAGAPARSIEDLAVRGAIDLVPIQGEPADKLRLRRAFYSQSIIEADTYRGIGQVETLGIGALWVTRATAPGDLIYKITQSLFADANRSTLENAHRNGRYISAASAVQGVPILLHPGAEVFYFEAGILER